jgi:hypothetical protein
MVDLVVVGSELVVRVRGFGKVLALKSQIRLPLRSIVGVRLDPDAVHGIWKGWRFPGTHIPGLVVAGTFYRAGKKAFWSVGRGAAVVIDLENAAYDQLVVEVEDPEATVRLLERIVRR